MLLGSFCFFTNHTWSPSSRPVPFALILNMLSPASRAPVSCASIAKTSAPLASSWITACSLPLPCPLNDSTFPEQTTSLACCCCCAAAVDQFYGLATNCLTFHPCWPCQTRRGSFCSFTYQTVSPTFSAYNPAPAQNVGKIFPAVLASRSCVSMAKTWSPLGSWMTACRPLPLNSLTLPELAGPRWAALVDEDEIDVVPKLKVTVPPAFEFVPFIVGVLPLLCSLSKRAFAASYHHLALSTAALFTA